MKRQYTMMVIGTVLIIGGLVYAISSKAAQPPGSEGGGSPSKVEEPVEGSDFPSRTNSSNPQLQRNRGPKPGTQRSPFGDSLPSRELITDPFGPGAGGGDGNEPFGGPPAGSSMPGGFPDRNGVPGMGSGLGGGGGFPGMGGGPNVGGPAPGALGGMMGSAMMPGEMIPEDMRAEQRLSNQTRQILQRYSDTEDESEKRQLMGKLAETVQQHFDLRQSIREKEIKALEAQVKKLRELHDRRNAEKERIVADRVDTLLRDASGLGWGENFGQPGFGGFSGPPGEGAAMPGTGMPGPGGRGGNPRGQNYRQPRNETGGGLPNAGSFPNPLVPSSSTGGGVGLESQGGGSPSSSELPPAGLPNSPDSKPSGDGKGEAGGGGQPR
jgi:hypothetical protein